jgi:rhodanese-related sulfurtransferase
MLALIAILISVSPAMAYDEALASTYQKFFSAFAEKDAAKALQFMTVKKVVEKLNKGEDLVLLDVRTRHEQSIIGLTHANTLHMPMDEVFRPENLAKIPTDKPVVVTCHSGVRCTAIALALRSIGFEKVFSMKGGLTELMKYLDAKTAFLAGDEKAATPAAGK